jgi:rhodanese-related sulfurtransferase
VARALPLRLTPVLKARDNFHSGRRMDQYIEFVGNHPILSLAWVALVALIVGGWFKSKFSAIRQINPQQLTLLINREDGVVVDIRAQKEFNNGRIAGAEHLSSEKAKQSDFSSLEKSKSKPIILVCTTGMTAMHKAGFESVYVLSGGMGAWQSAGLPTTTGR